MADTATLFTALRNADKAGDTAAAARIAAMIKAQPALQTAPQSASGTFGDVVAQTAKGLVTSIPNLISLPAQLGQWLGDKTRHGLDYVTGSTPEQIAGEDAIANQGRNMAINPANIGGNVAAATGIGEPQTFAGGVANTAANILPTLGLGGPSTLVQKGVSAVGAGLGGQTVKALVPDSWPIKPYLEAGATIVGGGAPTAISDLAAGNNISKIADAVQANPKALRTVGDSIGDTSAARTIASSLGPEAMLANLTPQATQDARALAAMGLENSPKIQTTAQSILDNSGTRAAQDWENTVGPMKTRYDKAVEIGAQKAGTSSMYQAARGVPIDPKPIIDAIPNIVDKAKNNPEARAAISEINDMLIDPRTGQFVTDAGELVNARIRIDELIKKAGAGQTVTPGADLYQIGKGTTTGGFLSQIRRTINDTLHQDPNLAQADSIFSDASRSQSAFELGNKKIIGSCDSVMEPQALEARWNKMSDQEKASVLEGLGRKGQNAIGDVRPNRNDGKAMADAFATPNNISRLDAMGLNSGTVQNMAAREDALASSNNRILGGSDTARTDLAKQKYVQPGQSLGGIPDLAINAGAGTGALVAALMHNPIIAAGIGAAWGTKKLAQIIVDSRRMATNNSAADLLSRTGSRASAVIDAIDKMNLSPNQKGLLLQRLSSQAALSAGMNAANNSSNH